MTSVDNGRIRGPPRSSGSPKPCRPVCDRSATRQAPVQGVFLPGPTCHKDLQQRMETCPGRGRQGLRPGAQGVPTKIPERFGQMTEFDPERSFPGTLTGVSDRFKFGAGWMTEDGALQTSAPVWMVGSYRYGFWRCWQTIFRVRSSEAVARTCHKALQSSKLLAPRFCVSN